MLKSLWDLLKSTFEEWREDKASRLAAALAYYTIFALPPLLLIVIAVAGFFLGRDKVQAAILEQISGLLGPQGAGAVETMLENVADPASGIIATIVGLVTLILGATGVFGQLQDALNTIWEVMPRPGRGIWATIRDRFLSFTMVLGIAFLLLVALVVSAAVSAAGKYLEGLLPASGLLIQIVSLALSFGVITLLFAMIYKILPDVEIAWSDVWLGAAVTALLFTLGKFALGLYLGRSGTASVYGAAGSLVLILLWVYYSAQILFFGAEFTQVYARKYGTRIVPDSDAVAMTEEQRAREGIPHREHVEQLAEGRKPDEAAAQPGLVAVDLEESRPVFEPMLPALPPPPPNRLVPALKRLLPGVAVFALGVVLGTVASPGDRGAGHKK